MSQARCCFCGTTQNLDYCKDCEKYFCPVCKKKYAARIRAMILEAARNPRSFARKAGKVLKVG